MKHNYLLLLRYWANKLCSLLFYEMATLLPCVGKPTLWGKIFATTMQAVGLSSGNPPSIWSWTQFLLSKIIWDWRTKSKGLLGWRFNIQNAIPKTEQLEKLFIDSNLDFLCLSESWLTELSPVATFTMPGCNYFRKDRKSGKGGGLLMYVKDHFKCKQTDLKCATEIECLAIISLFLQMSINIIGVYRSPLSWHYVL